MAKSTQKLPLRFYIQQYQRLGAEKMADEDAAGGALKLNKDFINKLKLIYDSLWTILSDFAAHSRTRASRQRFISEYLFESHKISGHPNVLMRCEMFENISLALILEQAVREPTFAGRAGLILGAPSSGRSNLLREWHAQPIIELDLTSSPRLFQVHHLAFQTHARDILERLISSPSEVAHVHEWFEETERVVTVPESSLRETTQWLSELNQEIATDRRASKALAESQNEAFLRLFASLANPRMGA